MEDDFSRAARKIFQNALMNLNVFFKKKARAARKFQKFRGICTFHFALGACATRLAADPKIVKLCTFHSVHNLRVKDDHFPSAAREIFQTVSMTS